MSESKSSKPKKPAAAAKAPALGSHRLEVFSVELWLDEVMERLRRTTIPVETDDQRAAFRLWLKAHIESVLYELRWAALKGAERGIEQVMNLASDPDYYDKSARRKKQRQEHAEIATLFERQRSALRGELDDKIKRLDW